MQLQPYQPHELTPANGDRIYVPTAPPTGPQPPSLVAVFAREAWKRKRLLFIWAGVTAVITLVVVLKIAHPVYRAEGKLSYRPNYTRGAKPVYTPPNIQSAVQILKSPDVLDPVRLRHVPNVSPEEFGKDVRIEVSKQSEFIDVGYDNPNPAVAAAVANDLMAEGMKYFTDVRVKAIKEVVPQVAADLAAAKRQLEVAKDAHRKTYQERGVDTDPESELKAVQGAISDIETQLRTAKTRQAQLQADIKYLKERAEAPLGPNDMAADDSIMQRLNIELTALQAKLLDQHAVDEAKIGLEAALNEEAQMRPLVAKNVIPRSEYDKVLAQIKKYEAVLKRADEIKKDREVLEKLVAAVKERARTGKPVRKSVLEELGRFEREEASLPSTIRELETQLKVKRKMQTALVNLQKELGPLEEEINLVRARVRDLDTQYQDAAGRTQDLNANDLRVHSQALTPTAAYSTNAPKLGLALVGASALLFVGYLALFCLPRVPVAPGGALAGPALPGLPRAMVALIPYPHGPAPASPAAGPATGIAPVAQMLAERIVRDGVDRGGVVLFAPTEEQLQVAPVIGDLGTLLTQRGDKVLIFDARQAAETPAWAGPQAPAVAASVEGYLDGKTEASAGCFVPTALAGVEYSRADLATRVTGVNTLHRFRHLVGEMRERYSVVFLVGPPVKLADTDPILAMMAEGLVLVTAPAADPVEVHAFLDTLCQQVPARLYGTLTVPKGAA